MGSINGEVMKRQIHLLITAMAVIAAGHTAQALELDWGGAFRAEGHYIRNYALDSDSGYTRDAVRENAGGYYIPGGGSANANFQNLFLKLKPKLIVNDNIYIKSEWWLGDPVFGFFGSAAPYSFDQRQFYSSQSRGSTISAQRFWADFVSDVGTVRIGRAPLHWGLGLVWNNGDGVWDRYASTGDTVALLTKFGSFSFMPSFTKYSMGNNISGSCHVFGGVCNTARGGADVTDISLWIKYENPDDDLEGGVNFIKRVSGAAQDPAAGYLGIGSAGTTQLPSGAHFNIWDLYGKKRFGKFSLAGELPITTGEVAGIDYKTFAFAVESGFKFNEKWETGLKFGQAAGQPNMQTPRPDRFKAFFFNPNYKVAHIMFNYQFISFAGPNSQNNPAVNSTQLLSPFDNPIVNARYINWGGSFTLDKWNFNTSFTYAMAIETAKPGSFFYNTWRRRIYQSATQQEQSKNMGWEMDYGFKFHWDEAFVLSGDIGFFFPGSFYGFSNTQAGNKQSMVMGGAVKAAVTF
ncbi:MAG: hypothetical protein A2583_03335 [Bdellovibrionales bacterium RIFOXYD1_FULL_53_11]|nr:MAG: hypothetical protein A2583_03335 [Bdellovibrionales bacterium RIFOXYD1_FULL_53_11]